MPEAVLESPLAGIVRLGQRVLTVDGRSCELSEEPFVAMLNVRGNAANASFAAAVLEVTGLNLPTQPNTASLSDHGQLLWLGPDEWLYKFKNQPVDDREAALREVFAGQYCSVVQVGDGNTTLTLNGPASADLLARGCPLDLHPRVFVAGALAQSHVAKASATILCLEAGTRYELTVRRSFADYLFRWLCAAGA